MSAKIISKVAQFTMLRSLGMVLTVGFVLTACNRKTENLSSTPIISDTPTTNAISIVPPPNTKTTNAPQPTTTTLLSPSEAQAHVGETATVRGKVFGVHITAKGDVFINVGAAYPNAPFTAVCFQGAIPPETLRNLDGKTNSFTGKIKDYNGQVEMVLDRAEQLGD